MINIIDFFLSFQIVYLIDKLSAKHGFNDCVWVQLTNKVRKCNKLILLNVTCSNRK